MVFIPTYDEVKRFRDKISQEASYRMGKRWEISNPGYTPPHLLRVEYPIGSIPPNGRTGPSDSIRLTKTEVVSFLDKDRKKQLLKEFGV